MDSVRDYTARAIARPWPAGYTFGQLAHSHIFDQYAVLRYTLAAFRAATRPDQRARQAGGGRLGYPAWDWVALGPHSAARDHMGLNWVLGGRVARNVGAQSAERRDDGSASTFGSDLESEAPSSAAAADNQHAGVHQQIE